MKCSVFVRRVLAAATILLLPIPLFAGSQGETESGSQDITLEILFRTFVAHEDDSEVERYMEEQLGFQIQFDARPPSNFAQTTQVVIASGDYPDVMEAWFADAEKEIRELAEDGVIAPLDDLLEAHGPNILEARPFDDNWYRPLADGDTYNIMARFNRQGFEFGWIIRQDWLDNLGHEVPETLEAFEEVARAFTFDDPDGNGKNDTYGVSSGWPAHARGTMFEYAKSAYGISNQWQEVDGELMYWAVNPGTLDALKFMRKLYLGGMIDPEFMLQQRPAWLENMRDGRYGMQFWWNTHLDVNASEWWAEFNRRQPDAKISFIPPAPTPAGERVFPGRGIKGYSPSDIVFADAPDANKVAAIQFFDLLASEDGWYLGAFGIKGKHWDLENGEVVSYVTGSEEQAAAGTYRFGWILRRSNVIPTNNLVRANLDFYDDYVVRPITEVQVPARSEYGGALGELTSSRFLKIQTEEGIDVNAEWQDFVETWKRSGGDVWTQQMNDAWK